MTSEDLAINKQSSWPIRLFICFFSLHFYPLII